MRIAIGSDKSGFLLKEAIKAYLADAEIEFDDLGTLDVSAAKPYYEVAPEVIPKVQDGTYARAILICGTGAGMSVLANKYKGVYAVACESLYAAKMARAINDANVLCMGGWIVGPEMGVQMAEVFLHTEFLQGLEPWRKTFLAGAAQRVNDLEQRLFREERQ